MRAPQALVEKAPGSHEKVALDVHADTTAAELIHVIEVECKVSVKRLLDSRGCTVHDRGLTCCGAAFVREKIRIRIWDQDQPFPSKFSSLSGDKAGMQM